MAAQLRTEVPPPPQPPLYILGANDVISVLVSGRSDLSGTCTIGPDRLLYMPGIKEFMASGVQLLRNNSKKYTLIGAVRRPGPYSLLQETTILDALAASGGCNDLGNKEKILLRRGTKDFPFDYLNVIAGQHLEQNIWLGDGDIIVVPE